MKMISPHIMAFISALAEAEIRSGHASDFIDLKGRVVQYLIDEEGCGAVFGAIFAATWDDKTDA
jgi:hypothetical protein